jgi:hypothetical protein
LQPAVANGKHPLDEAGRGLLALHLEAEHLLKPPHQVRAPVLGERDVVDTPQH